MMTLTANQTVREIAIDNPEAVRVFESLGIDYCCGGGASLKDACVAASISVDEVLQRLTATTPTARSEDLDDYRQATLQAITSHIVEKHHGFVRRETPRLQGLLDKVRNRHDQNHPELRAIEEMFNIMSEELTTHMFKEEQLLFPHIQRLEAAVGEGRPAPRPPFGTVANPIARMMAEHDNAGELLKQMRSAARGYMLPDGACPTYEMLYRGLQEFEQDLHIHVHLENNILFPRAVELERSANGGRSGGH
jgi:regulator of cell morphogenesis and NO signaling